MEEDYQNRLSSQLIIFEKNSKEWEWSDLIKWLSGLKQIIDKFSIPVPQEHLNTLSKRLGQCLSASLPHGLHSKALEIYSILLATSSFYQMTLLSTGLFPHFQFCAPQNKPQFLELIRQRFIDRFSETKFLLKGLLASLLQGANETPDTFAKVSEVLERCEAKDQRVLYEIVWWFVLKSPCHRLAGLQFMLKRNDCLTDPVRIHCALLSALDDEVVVNRRNALDFIRNNYLIDRPIEGLIGIAQGVLRLLRTKDHTVLRRIWEWIFPNDFDENQATFIEDVIRPALLLIFKETHSKVVNGEGDQAKIDSIKIIENLCDHEQIGDILSKVIIIDIVKHTIDDQLFWVNEKVDNRIKQVVLSKGPELFWSCLESKLDSFLEEDQEMLLKILWYGKQNFEQDQAVPSRIITEIFLSLPLIQNLVLALDLLISFSSSLELDSVDIDPVLSLFKHHLKAQNLEVIKKFGILFSKLVSLGTKTAATVKLVKKTLKRKFRLGVIPAVKFRSILNHELVLQMWQEFRLDDRDDNELMLEAFTSNKQDWNLATNQFLINPDQQLEEGAMRKFIKFWDYMNKQHPSALHSISKNTGIIYTLVDQLCSEDPVSRLMAEEWLYTAQVHIGNVFDPVLKILLRESAVRDINSDGIYQCHQEFKSNVVEKSLKFVQLVISCGGKDLVLRMEKCPLSYYCQGKCSKHSLLKNNYLELLIQLSLSYLQTAVTPAYLESPTRYNPLQVVSNIQDLASDLLILITKNSSKGVCEFALSQISEIFYKFINIKTRLDVYLLQVIENMFLFNRPEFKLPSIFKDCLVLGLRKDSKKIRLKWNKIIKMILPRILFSIQPDSQFSINESFLTSIFESYFEVMIKLKDFSLMEGLVYLVNTCLGINSKEPSSNHDQELKAVVNKQTRQVIKLTFVFYLEKMKDISLINQLVIPIKSFFISEFIDSIYNIWISFVVPKTQVRETETIINMIPNLQITAEEILDFLSKSMEKQKDPSKEIHMCNFCQQIISNLEKFKIPVTNTLLWTRVLTLLRRLQSNDLKESQITSINILFTIARKAPVDPKVLKEVQDLVKVLIIENFSTLVLVKDQALNSFYYSVENSETVGLKYLKAVHERGCILFEKIWPERQEKDKNSCLVTFVNNLFLSLHQVKEGNELVCDLIFFFLKDLSQGFGEGVKKNLFEFLKNSLMGFIHNFPKSFKTWKLIVNRAALNFYPDRSSLLLDLMYEFDPGLLGSFWSHSSLVSNLYNSASLMCFMIFSGSKGMYSKILQGITEKVKEILKYEDSLQLQKVFLLLCKILYLRLSPHDFSVIWKLAWPSLSSYFARYLNKIDKGHTFEVLKFFDFALATNFDEYCNLGFFFIDLPEFVIVTEPTHDFQPACMRFLNGFSARQSRSSKDVYSLTSIREKKLILTGRKPESEEDIENFGKCLIQYSSCYSSEYLDTDFNSIENDLEKELIELG